MSQENKLRNDIVGNINNTHIDCHAAAIDAPELSPGYPDIDMVLKGIQMGVELKHVEGNGGAYKVQSTQIAFTRRRANAAGIILWMLVVKDAGVYITLGCPHDTAGTYRWSDETKKIWTGSKTGCMFYGGIPTDWAKAIYSAAQSLAP